MKKITLDAGKERFRFILGDYCKWLRIIKQSAGMIPIILIGTGTKLDFEKHEIENKIADKYTEDVKYIMNVWSLSKLNYFFLYRYI